MPFPPSKRPPRHCVLCGHPELIDARGLGRFLLVPDPDGRGPICPPLKGCGVQRQRERDNASLTPSPR
ncbi:hypothetical protein F0U60_26520 [Archangium minus]|uniref:Uncharacterized protein n=1 Tax=Archangium minus TaxID=83450 RepID=A0ABY9WU21_9BACT|nr:hypothetical protein F0U61_26815 [Archangium violaceum]WNG47282.1 hypothetical protein F0U60_26520 [Archangium minus]